jgi:hypothetical protein
MAKRTMGTEGYLLEPLTDDEADVILAMRAGAEYKRTRQTVLDIEDMLTLYDVPIMAPLADSILRLCEQRDRMSDLLKRCATVVANDDLHKEIEDALAELP